MKFNNIWYGKHPLGLALAPVAWLFCAVVRIRRLAYKHGLLTSHRVPVPVIVVGNITVGGTGKTPLVIWLAQFFKKQGFKPGIVSRGYGGRAIKWPQPVYPNSDPHIVGDEPVLLARHCGCPVVVAPKRIKAVQNLLENNDCNLIISDDGLQHYALYRDLGIAVLDDVRRYGNRRCLPAGPLREPVSYLKKIDFLVTKGAALRNEFSMQYDLKPLRHVMDENISKPLAVFRGQTVHAVAGIGHPAKFFTRLRNSGLKLLIHEFPDHHYYSQTDIQFQDNLPVIMTEKDAVKCVHFAGIQHWYLPIEARLPKIFADSLLQKLKGIENGQKIA
ncbi:MAG: tetraacyldisaccharide 4'-kinase [Gammaproteobacteria bacterium]|nr:MAG: tetraacyldisaccharide 4'-kinase [Gammaproteobacteria bacterium]RKZ41757.1 MAG: tetraacyldisaccharide 4'-kinase [Gammaproteobacteria bacterium]